MSSLEHIYTPPGYASSYSSLLRTLYEVNNLLKKDGIMAPSSASFDNTMRAYELIGRPLDSSATEDPGRIKVVHVGGTNGKGSTSFKISECLHRSGIVTGLFVSPHLSSFRERVQINGQLVSEEQVVLNLPRVLELCAAHSIPLTLFEITFVFACIQFQASGCQAVVLEVGVGGELDATNVVKTALSIVCSVSLDHTRILGATVEEIAAKKGGIFKRDVDALVGPGCPMQVLREIAAERGARLHELADVAGFVATAQVDGGGLVDTDALNADISRAALLLLRAQRGVFSTLDPNNEPIRTILQQVRPPCRWECHETTVDLPAAAGTKMVQVVLDVGHNPAAVGALMNRIKREFSGRNVHLLYAMSRDKDVRTCLRCVLEAMPFKNIHFAQTSNFRALSKDDLASIFRQETGEDMLDLEAATAWWPQDVAAAPNSVQQTLSRLLALAASEADDSVVVICGTGYIMPDARERLGVIEPRDDRDLLRP